MTYIFVYHIWKHLFCFNSACPLILLRKWKVLTSLRRVFPSCFLTIPFFSPCFLSNSLFHSFLFSVPLFLHLLAIVLLPASLPYYLPYFLLLQFLYGNSIALEIHCLVISLKQNGLDGIHTHSTDCFITHCERVSFPAITCLDIWSDKVLCPVELVSCADPMTYSSKLLECQTSSWSWIRKWLLERYWHTSLSWLSVWGREILQTYPLHTNNVAVFTPKNYSPEDHVIYCSSAVRCARQERQQSSKQFQLFPGSSFSVEKKDVLWRVSSWHFFKAISDIPFLAYNATIIMRDLIWIH